MFVRIRLRNYTETPDALAAKNKGYLNSSHWSVASRQSESASQLSSSDWNGGLTDSDLQKHWSSKQSSLWNMWVDWDDIIDGAAKFGDEVQPGAFLLLIPKKEIRELTPFLTPTQTPACGCNLTLWPMTPHLHLFQKLLESNLKWSVYSNVQ